VSALAQRRDGLARRALEPRSESGRTVTREQGQSCACGLPAMKACPPGEGRGCPRSRPSSRRCVRVAFSDSAVGAWVIRAPRAGRRGRRASGVGRASAGGRHWHCSLERSELRSDEPDMKAGTGRHRDALALRRRLRGLPDLA
jgi:hypothetical protein